MSRDRFYDLLRFIRFDNRDVRNLNDKFSPIRSIFGQIVKNFQTSYKAGPTVTVDEQLVSFRGRCPFKIYVPSKPGKYGMKLWALADTETFYCMNLLPYIGRVCNVPERGQGQRVVLELTDMISGSGRHVVMDNFFCSLGLGRILLGRSLTMTGTLRKNKPEIPTEMLPHPERAENSSIFGFQRDATIVSYVPKKNKAVVLLTTLHKTPAVSEDNARKPEIILEYNKGKCGVDTLDQLVRMYNCIRKCNRWPMTLFMNLLNVAAYNAQVLFLSIHPEYESRSGQRRKRFLLELSKSLLPIAEPVHQMLNESVHCHEPASFSASKRRCNLCPRNRDRKSNIMCRSCKKNLCREHVNFVCRHC